MQASSNDSDRPQQRKQQQDLVTQFERKVPCLEENRHHQHHKTTVDDDDDDEGEGADLESNPAVSASNDRMPPHSASFPLFDRDFSSSSNAPVSKCGLETAYVRQESLPSSSWTCSSDELLFPTKLFYMLNDAHEKGFEHIVSWGHGPSSFNVHQKKAFEDHVLPKYFKMTKYKSFTRQLHNYEFQWIRGGPDKGGYCHKYFSRDGTNVDQLLSRKAIALAQTSVIGTGISENNARDSPLPNEGVRRWSAPECLGGVRQQSPEDGKSKQYGTDILPPLHASASCASLLEAHQHRVELKRCESEPMNVSTHSGGYPLPPFVASMWKSTSSGSSLSQSNQERSMAPPYTNHGGGDLVSARQKDALNPLLTISGNNMALLSNSHDSLCGRSSAAMPTTTLSGTALMGDLATAAARFVNDPQHSTAALSDLLARPHAHTLNISGIQVQGRQSLQTPPRPSFHTSQVLAGRGASSSPSSCPSFPATMMMDRDDVLVNLGQSSASSSFPLSSAFGGDGTTGTQNTAEKLPGLLMFKEEEATTMSISHAMTNINQQDGMYDDETHGTTIPSMMEPRTIEEMMQDDDHTFR